MNYTVRAAPRLHYEWLKKRCGCEVSDGYRAIEALDNIVDFCPRCGLRHGCVRGMIGFSGWTPNSVRMDVALDAASALRPLLGPAFEYAFGPDRQLVLVVISSDNARSLALTDSAGFLEKYRVPDGWAPGVDLVVKTLSRRDCRFLRGTK